MGLVRDWEAEKRQWESDAKAADGNIARLRNALASAESDVARFRSALKNYMRHVVACEGTYFLVDFRGAAPDEENALIHEIAREIDIEAKRPSD